MKTNKSISKYLGKLDRKIPFVTDFSFWLESQRPKNYFFLKPILKLKDFARNYAFSYREKKVFVRVMPSKKTIYLNIPKNGSTSLGEAFKEHIKEDIYKMSPENIMKHEDYYKFVVVRNPYDRVYSAYCHFISKPNNQSRKIFNGGMGRNFWRYGDKFYPEMSFERFVDALCKIPDKLLDEHVVPQSYFVTNERGELFVDEFFKLKNIEKEFQKICKKIDVECEKLPIKNKTYGKGDFKENCSQETLNKIYQRYKRDFELFDYERVSLR